MSDPVDVVHAESLIPHSGNVHRLEEPPRDPVTDRVLVNTNPSGGVAEG